MSFVVLTATHVHLSYALCITSSRFAEGTSVPHPQLKIEIIYLEALSQVDS